MDVDIHIVKADSVEDSAEGVLQDGARVFKDPLTHEGEVQGHAGDEEAAQGCELRNGSVLRHD